MDTQLLLLDRLRALSERLNLAQQAVGAAPAFASAIEEKREELKRAICGAKKSGFSWHGLAALEDAHDAVFREVLAFQRAEGWHALRDSDAAPVARGLVNELAAMLDLSAAPVVAPDVDDLFSDFVQIIRLRYPPAGIWDVPVVAHELGHFTAYRKTGPGDGIQRPQPLREFIDGYFADHGIKGESDRKRWLHWLNELFADAFATHCVGPSFAASVLLLRFGPSKAYGESATHPSPAARAAAILETLEQISDGEAAPYAMVIKYLRKRWAALIESGENNIPELVLKMDEAQSIARGLFYQVVRQVAPRAQYGGWRVVADLLRYRLTDYKAVKPGFQARDLINAAWLARIERPDIDAETINARALQLWQGRAGG